LKATAPNQLYNWDITYLPTAVKGGFFYLYLFMDVYSGKIVGWQVYERESSEWAADIVRDIVPLEGITHQQVTLHSDNGGPMKGSTMLATLQTLGILPSFSRPAVSNDNPYSEALFKTLKYRSDYPARPFANLHQARRWVAGFVGWYNREHRHRAILYVTPEQRHTGQDRAILKRRKAVYEAAKQRRPERWRGPTRNWDPVREVYLNPDQEATNCGRQALKQAA
jgi:putative transposase